MLCSNMRRSIHLIFLKLFTLGSYVCNTQKRHSLQEKFLEKVVVLYGRILISLLLLPFGALSTVDAYAVVNSAYPLEFSLNRNKSISPDKSNVLSISLTATNVTCKGLSNGSVTSTIAGASGGSVNYTLTPGSGSNSTGLFTNLSAGVYTVLVDDAGITATASIIITEPTAILSSAISSQLNVLCKGGSTGSVTVAGIGGTAGYTYSIDGGLTFQSIDTFGSLVAGSYNITILDANGCTAIQPVSIIEPSLSLSSSITSQTNVLCKGGTTGSVTVAGIGGTALYTYSIDGGLTFQATGTFGLLASGSYSIAVKDAHGCTVNQPVSIIEPALSLGSSIISQSNVLCKGGATGSVTVSGIGGTAGYTYSIDGGATYQASGTFGSLIVGTYTIRVKDTNGCIFDRPILITEPALALSVLSSSNSPVCSNATLNLSATGTGGTGTFTYSWSGPNSFSSTSQNPSIVNPPVSASGNYTVTIKDANNCSAISTTAVSVYSAPTVTASASISSICAGGSVTLTSSSNIPPPPSLPAPVMTFANFSSGGTVASADWTSRPDGYITNGLTFHSNDNSSFYLSDSRAQNGTKTETVMQTQAYNTVGYSTLALDFWHYYRFNNSTNESAKVQVSTDGTTWITVANYTTTLGASNGFINENINLIAYINKPVFYIRFYYYSDLRARYWAIDNVTLTGLSTTAAPIISWSSNPAGYSSSVANPPTVSPATTTTYTATYTNPVTGCSNSASTTITVNPTPIVTIQPNYCAVPGHVRLTANGGATYTWSTGETTNPIFTDIANTYGVTTTNAFGCTGSAFLPVSTELVVNGDFSGGNTGFTNAYGYTTAANGLFPEGLYGVGADPTFFHSNFWGRDHTSNSGKFLIVNGIGSAGVVIWQETVTVVPHTDYYFSAWAISLNSVPPYADLQFNVNGSLVGTTAPLAARAGNNNPPYNWQRFYGNWNSGTATTAIIQIVDLQTALGGNDFGLDDVSFGTLAPIPFTISPSVNPSATACSGKTMYLKANITGGRSPITYSWTGPNGFTSNQKDPVIPNVTVGHSGLYTLSVIDGYGCDPVIGSVNATVLPSPTPQISSISGNTTVCPGSLEKYWTAVQSNVTNSWSATGGAIVGSAVTDFVDIQWGVSGNGLISLTSTNTVNGCDSMVTKSILIQDIIPPTLAVPASFGFCVEDLFSAAIVSNLLKINPSPDYYLFKKGSTVLDLDPTTFADNCTPVNQLVIHWRIDYSSSTPTPSISGTGQFSSYLNDIIFPGDGITFLDVTHTITYWLVDTSGNESVHKTVNITIHPRPAVSYYEQNTSSNFNSFLKKS